MDILFWNKANNNIKFKETKKQFFGQYLWRLELDCECADLINPVYVDMMAEVKRRRVVEDVRKNFGGSWKLLINTNKFDNVDYTLLQTLRNIRTTYGDNIKIRIEDPSVQLYAKTQDELKVLALSLGNTNCIKSVTGPKTGTEQLLAEDKIIASDRIKHRYKIVLRDGSYELSSKHQLLNLLRAQDAEVKLTTGLVHNLTRPYKAIWGAFFYCNDLSLVTMINLISPGMVGKIHEVVHSK